MDKTANVFVGLPGSGKTTAAHVATEALDDAERYEVSTYIRNVYQEETGKDDSALTDNELGEWTSEIKDEYGRGHFVQYLCDNISRTCDASTVNIAGVRSPEEAAAIRAWFDESRFITIWTLPDLRYDRLSGRESEYSYQQFNERTERELFKWDCIKFFTDPDYYDHIVPNNFSIQGFENAIDQIVNGATLHTNQPWPEDMPSEEHVAQYL